jgi:hypothetical protein
MIAHFGKTYVSALILLPVVKRPAAAANAR